MTEVSAAPDPSLKKGKKKRPREEEDGGRDGKRRKQAEVANFDVAPIGTDASTAGADASHKKKKKKDKTKGGVQEAPNTVVDAVLAAPAQPSSTTPPAQSLDDILNSSGGDMMDMLQGFNVSQLGGVLKGLGSAATESNVRLHSISTTMPTAAAPRATRVTASGKKKGNGAGGRKSTAGTRTKAPPASVEGFDISNAAELLATRWWRPKQLNELAKNHGQFFVRI